MGGRRIATAFPSRSGTRFTQARAASRQRRLARGVYDDPKEYSQLSPLSPLPDAMARAVAGSDRMRPQPAGVYAANSLGLVSAAEGRRRSMPVTPESSCREVGEYLLQGR
ncbi:MAG: DUF6088 family protein [Planctomycetota bacterium]